MPNGEKQKAPWETLPLPGTPGAVGARTGQWGSLGQAAWSQPPKTYEPAKALTYEEFLLLSPEEQQEVLKDPSGSRLPQIGGGYDWRWIFNPQLGFTWELYDKQAGAETEAQDWMARQQMLQPEPMSEYQQNLIRLREQEMGAGGQPTGMTELQQQQLELQQSQLGLQERQWQAGLAAHPSDWIERWYAENAPKRQAAQTNWIPSNVREQEIQKGGGQNPRELYNKDVQAIREAHKTMTPVETSAYGSYDPGSWGWR